MQEVKALRLKCPVLKGNRFNQYLARLEFIAKMEKALQELATPERPFEKIS